MSPASGRPIAEGPASEGVERARALRWIGWGGVALAVVFNLVVLRAERLPVQQLNDNSIHASMVRWAEGRMQAGHLPVDGWYPFLSLGSSRFHHYQSFPHIVTAAAQTVLPVDDLFQWSLYLLLALWPIAVYVGGRLLGWEPLTAGCAALVSPLLVGAPGLGYEYGSYLWRGAGTWTQLWGMWLLPLTWGLGWRWISDRRWGALAVLALALTLVSHLITGYLAVLILASAVLLRPAQLKARIVRFGGLVVGALFVASWLLVPLFLDRDWMLRDEFSRGKIYYDSFGAGRILAWLVSGRLFDAGRLPVVTVFVFAGFGLCARSFRRDERARMVLVGGTVSLILFFGRPTLGPLVSLLPGGEDLFLRRFVIGVDLAAIYLAGVAAAKAITWVANDFRIARRTWPVAGAIATAVLVVVALAPAWLERAGYASTDARWIAEQRIADARELPDLRALIADAHLRGPGRIYAGKRSNWGSRFRIGQVPVYAALLNADVDAIGFTRPTWSLSSNVESRFDDRVAAQYELFGIRYLILPSGTAPNVPAVHVGARGAYGLWEVSGIGYARVVDTTRAIAADRTNLGEQTAAFLRSPLVEQGIYPGIAFDGRGAVEETLPESAPAVPPGVVVSTSAAPAAGRFDVRVDAARRAFLVVAASFDPRWTATIDGRPAAAEMVAPSFVGTVVPAGEHRVTLQYRPYPFYWVWAVVAIATLFAFGTIGARHRGGRRSGSMSL